MTTLAKSLRAETPARLSMMVYLGLMGCLVLVKIVLELGSIGGVVPSQAALFSWPMIGSLAVVGGLCVWLGPRAGLPYLWDPKISPRKRFLLPAILGLGLGAANLTVQGFTNYARLMAETGNIPTINVPFPGSIVFYTGGAIIVETLYRLILITLPVWLIANVILRKRGQVQVVFWVVALLTSTVEAWGQVTLMNGNTGLMIAVGLAMYGLNVVEAFLFWRLGLLAPLVFRIGFYLVWHVVGGLMGV